MERERRTSGERRKRQNAPLLDEDIQLIATQLAKNLVLNDRLSKEAHDSQHEFLASWIEREKRKAELWDKIKTSVLQNGAWALVLGLIAMAGLTLKLWLRPE